MDNITYNIKKLRNKFLKNYNNNAFEKAQKCGEELVEYYKKNNLTALEEYGNDVFNLACAYDEAGNYEKAAEVYRVAADAVDKRSGKSLKLSDIYNNLGIVHSEMHQADMALAYFKKCINIRQAILGSDNKDNIDTLYNLGSAYKNLHRFNDAVQCYAKSLNLRDKKDMAYADNLYNLGMCYVEIKDYEVGLDYIKNALPIYKEITSNPDEYITALNIYASLLYKLEKYADSIKSQRELVEIIKEHYGTTQPFYANALSLLADCYEKTDNLEMGISLKQKAINILKKCCGTNHVIYASYLSELGEFYLAAGEYAKAAALYSQALDIRTKILGLDDKDCVEYVQTLASIYSLMKLYNKAEDLLNYALNNLSKANKNYGKIVLELVKLYMDAQDGEGLNRVFFIFNKIYPEKSFDEMLDMAEDMDLI